MSGASSVEETAVRIPAGGVHLDGILAIPEGTASVVLFVHGSGSSRLSPRNRQVAGVLQDHGIATLLFDLLTPEEAAAVGEGRRFDIPLLAQRLGHAMDWVLAQPSTKRCVLGLFGASTGTAAALVATAAKPSQVNAIVSRGGRPDLAADAIRKVRVPTLLIVGGDDPEVLGWNREAYDELRCLKGLEVIPGAGHLFEEAGALERVSLLALEWFSHYLKGQEFVGARR